MTELQRNSKMFYLIAEAIEEKPEMHYQSTWISFDTLSTTFVAGREVTCGTSQCVAGWAMVFEGRATELVKLIQMSYDVSLDWEIRDNVQHKIIEEGASILGLSKDEAELLFTTTRHDLNYPAMLRAIGDGDDVANTITSARIEADRIRPLAESDD